MPKLSDAQALLLSAAAARPDLSVFPAPDTLKVRGDAFERTLDALLRRGLIAKSPTKGREKGEEPCHRQHRCRPKQHLVHHRGRGDRHRPK